MTVFPKIVKLFKIFFQIKKNIYIFSGNIIFEVSYTMNQSEEELNKTSWSSKPSWQRHTMTYILGKSVHARTHGCTQTPLEFLIH